MNKSYRVSAIVLATVALGGCQSVFGTFFTHVGTRAPEPALAALPSGEGDLAAARELMDEGRIAEAVDHFRAAQADPVTLSAASNGLGVAYARLGRFDLADRYFGMAVALEPANERYAANMLRLQRDYALARQVRDDQLRLAEARTREEAAMAVAERPGAIERVSRGEVRIATAQVESSAPLAVVAMRDAPPAPARSAIADRPAQRYPVQIDLAKVAKAEPAEPAEYPVRIDLSKVVTVD